tara:strand:- start:7831 stop:8169 length:339 start_codon:yes stop_codon:yes gene_type:complete
MGQFSVGAMREQVTVQNQTRTADGAGGYSETLVTNFKTFASVKTKIGREQVKQGQLQDRKQFEFVIRYRSDKNITAANRILWGTRVFQVRSVVNYNERNKYYVITAEENVAA